MTILIAQMERALRSAGPLTEPQARECARNICAALAGLTADDRQEIAETILGCLDHRAKHTDTYGPGYDAIDRVSLTVELAVLWIDSLMASEQVAS